MADDGRDNHRSSFCNENPPRPSLSTRRVMAMMEPGVFYTIVEMHRFSQSENHADIMRQLNARDLIFGKGEKHDREWCLSEAGETMAEFYHRPENEPDRRPEAPLVLTAEEVRLKPGPKRGAPRVPRPAWKKIVPRITETQAGVIVAIHLNNRVVLDSCSFSTISCLIRKGIAEFFSPENVVLTAKGSIYVKEIMSC